MGEKLIKYYKYIKDEMGYAGSLKLAQLTKVPSTIASTHEDSPEVIKIFQDAIKQLTSKDAPEF